MGLIAATASARAEEAKLRAAQPVQFQIPAQPLAQALENFGIATGINVFYNAAIAERRHSNPVIGLYTPGKAIQLILAGSGFAARVTAPGSLVIGSENGRNPEEMTPGRDTRYEPYFSQMQERIEQVLCPWPEPLTTRGDLLLRLWLRPSGDVARAEMLVRDGGNEAVVNQSIATAISRVKFTAPPADMPRPITLVVLPPSPQGELACAASRREAFDHPVRQ